MAPRRDLMDKKENRRAKKDLQREIEKRAKFVTRSVADRVVELAVDTLNDKGISNTGNLASSWEIRELEDGRIGYRVTFDAGYAAFVEFGTAPHWPPPEPIRRWVEDRVRGGDLELDGSSVSDVTFLIQRKIAQEGTSAQPFVRPAQRRATREVSDIAERVLD